MNIFQTLSARLFRPWQAATKQDLKTTEENIMSTISTLKEQLDAIAASATKANGEVKAKLEQLNKTIEELTRQLADAEIPADAQASLDALKGIVKEIDDQIPDAPTEPPAQG